MLGIRARNREPYQGGVHVKNVARGQQESRPRPQSFGRRGRDARAVLVQPLHDAHDHLRRNEEILRE